MRNFGRTRWMLCNAVRRSMVGGNTAYIAPTQASARTAHRAAMVLSDWRRVTSSRFPFIQFEGGGQLQFVCFDKDVPRDENGEVVLRPSPPPEAR